MQPPQQGVQDALYVEKMREAEDKASINFYLQ